MMPLFSPPRLEKIARTTVVIAAVFTVVFFLFSAFHARNLDWNAARLATTEAAVRGLPLYAPPDSGVLVGEIYLPLSALAFAPAVAVTDISAKLVAGSLLALLYFFAPFVLFARAIVRHGHAPAWAVLGAVAAAALYAGFDPALRYGAVMIHAEAPAAGLACLAIVLAAAPQRNRAGLFAAGVAAVAAGLCKQTWFAVFPLLAILAARRDGRRAAWPLIGGGAATTIVFGLGVTAFGDWRNLYYNTVVIPAGHPWQTSGWTFVFGAPATHQSWPERLEALMLAFIPLAARVWPFAAIACWAILRGGRPAGGNDPLARRVAWYSGWLALVQIPISLAGLVKVGGDVNTVMPFLAPALLCATALLFWLFERFADDVSAPDVSAALVALLVVLMVCNAPRLGFLLRTAVQTDDPHRRIIAYLREHPGEVYLPWNPLVTWTAEHRRDHFESGVFERVVSGRIPSRAQYLACLPPRLHFLALRRTQTPSCREMYLHYLPAAVEVASPPGLEDWKFYALPPSAP